MPIEHIHPFSQKNDNNFPTKLQETKLLFLVFTHPRQKCSTLLYNPIPFTTLNSLCIQYRSVLYIILPINFTNTMQILRAPSETKVAVFVIPNTN